MGEGTKAGVARCENEVCETGTNLAGIVIASLETTRGARIKEGGTNEHRGEGTVTPISSQLSERKGDVG